MKIRKPKYTKKEYRKKHFKHHKRLENFTEKQLEEYNNYGLHINLFRKQTTKQKNIDIKNINKHFVSEEVIAKKTEKILDQYENDIDKFCAQLRFTGEDKKHIYTEKLNWNLGKTYIGEIEVILSKHKKLKEIVKYINKKKIGGYIQCKIKYFDKNGNIQFYGKTMYPHAKIDVDILTDMIVQTEDTFHDDTKLAKAYTIDAEKQIEYFIYYTLPL